MKKQTAFLPAAFARCRCRRRRRLVERVSLPLFLFQSDVPRGAAASRRCLRRARLPPQLALACPAARRGGFFIVFFAGDVDVDNCIETWRLALRQGQARPRARVALGKKQAERTTTSLAFTSIQRGEKEGEEEREIERKKGSRKATPTSTSLLKKKKNFLSNRPKPSSTLSGPRSPPRAPILLKG